MSQRRVLAVAPHPDDETIGLGGTLLRHIADGDDVAWMVVTAMTDKLGFSAERQAERHAEIERVTTMYGFCDRFDCGLPTTELDALPRADVVQAIGGPLKSFRPDVVYLPHPHDVHSDHGVVFQATATNLKWFRLDSVREVYTYETLSETEFGLDAGVNAFRPTSWVDISPYLERKLEIMSVYDSELGEFPFPRSLAAMRHQSHLRGAEAGCNAAEAFTLLRSRR